MVRTVRMAKMALMVHFWWKWRARIRYWHSDNGGIGGITNGGSGGVDGKGGNGGNANGGMVELGNEEGIIVLIVLQQILFGFI
jgi:hypothetical protein